MNQPNTIELTDEPISELPPTDEWSDKCIPTGGYVENRDPTGRRNGKQPVEKMGEVLTKATEEALAQISKVTFISRKVVTFLFLLWQKIFEIVVCFFRNKFKLVSFLLPNMFKTLWICCKDPFQSFIL